MADLPDGSTLLHDEPEESKPAPDSNAMLLNVTSQTPWWVVSILLHALVITFAGLLSIVIKLPEQELNVTVTEITPAVQDAPSLPKPVRLEQDTLKHILAPSNENANSVTEDKNAPQIYVLPEVTDFTEAFQTNNPEMENDHSAFGIPDSQIFTGISNDSEAGGGAGSTILDQIGVGEGKFGFGTSSLEGVGPGNGKGHGAFGGRFGGRSIAVRRAHVNPECIVQSNLALQWLAANQEYDGHWDAKRHGANYKSDTAVTALALLAFLGNGETEKVGKFQENVRRGVSWLRSKQGADGLVWDTTDDGAHHRAKGYPGAIAALALAEAAGMGKIPETIAVAQKAIDYITEIHQSGEGSDRSGWRYAAKDGNPDTSVSGWNIMAIKSAKIAGLHVNPAAFQGAIRFLDSVEHRNPADTGYDASQYWYTKSDAHNESSHRLTAIGTLARQFLGWKKDELETTVKSFIDKGGAPAWGANGESVDLYYWYYGSLCAYQQGGDSWARFSKPMMATLMDHQQKDGSFDPAGAFCNEWGRAGQTALSALCMEVAWRYGKLQVDK